jgi:hypothetical protein
VAVSEATYGLAKGVGNKVQRSSRALSTDLSCITESSNANVMTVVQAAQGTPPFSEARTGGTDQATSNTSTAAANKLPRDIRIDNMMDGWMGKGSEEVSE